MNHDADLIILAIESSCDDTAVAVLHNGKILANIVWSQTVHASYGGVVPELASRDHQKRIIPAVRLALEKAGMGISRLNAIAYTRGPGLSGSLLVGSSVAKAMALALGIPLLEVHHMHAHIMAHFIQDDETKAIPEFPILCLTVSGGHTQIVLMEDYFHFRVIGETLDDAAGEAFDKAAKVMGLPYPGGPLIDKFAVNGNPQAFHFPKTKVPGLNFSFSGFKTAFLNFIHQEKALNPLFVQEHLADICASVQYAITGMLSAKLNEALETFPVKSIALAGGVSANSSLRKSITEIGKRHNIPAFIPPMAYCTDNAAMIAITGWLQYKKGFTGKQQHTVLPSWNMQNLFT